MLKDTIKKDLMIAMKEKNNIAKDTIRGLLSAFTNKLISEGKLPSEEVTDDLAISVIKTEVKRRKDSIEQFETANRADLSENEKKELEILKKYLPKMMSEQDILKIAKNKKEELGISDKSKMGILIGAIIKETAGNADGGVVKNVVSKLF